MAINSCLSLTESKFTAGGANLHIYDGSQLQARERERERRW